MLPTLSAGHPAGNRDACHAGGTARGHRYNPPVSLLAPLNPDQRATFVVVSLPQKTLRKLVGRLGTLQKGLRLESQSAWDLAWSLVDYYEDDVEVADEVDRALAKDLGESPLGAAVASDGSTEAVTSLLLSAKDPARDLVWAILNHAPEAARPLAAELVQTIIREFDEADERAKQEGEAPGPESGEAAAAAPEEPSVEDEIRAAEKEAKRAQSARERALKRLDATRERVAELEESVAVARRDLRTTEEARAKLAAERDRLAEERTALRAQLQTGTAGEVTRLGAELADAQRLVRNLESELEEVRESERALSARLRSLAEARPAATGVESDGEQASSPSGAAWSMPIFTDEFYDSIRRWDRKIVRNAFEKVYRLAEDWRHPSLRATALEGIPGFYRIRVATDVRLMYRVLDGNRIEILSLIDREDLQRYIRQAKTRQA